MDIITIFVLTAEAAAAYALLLRSSVLNTRSEKALSAALILSAFLIRAAMFDYETTDYQWFLTRWVDYFRQNGGFSALKGSIGNYNIPYLYFLALFSVLPVRDLYLIKLLSTFFDVLLAASCMKLVIAAGGSGKRSKVCFFAVLFLPTVMINGALWGQCDSIYVSFAVLGLAIGSGSPSGKDSRFPERLRPLISMACIAVSFGFKLQAVFIMPAYAILWSWKKYKWVDFAVFPLTYLLLILPSVLIGRPFRDALLLYADQANTVGSALNYNSPSMTAFLRNIQDPDGVSLVCIILAFAAMLLLLFTGIMMRSRLNGRSFTALTLLMVLLIPFLLPHMHDRYFFAADCLTVVFACIQLTPAGVARGGIASGLMQFGSLICYIAYLKSYYLRVGNLFLTSDKGALAVIFCIFIVIQGFISALKEKRRRERWHT